MNKSTDWTDSLPQPDFPQNSQNPETPAFFRPSCPNRVDLSDGNSENSPPPLENTLDRELLKSFLLGKTQRTQESYKRIVLEFLSFLNPVLLRNTTLGSMKAFLELKSYQAHESKRLRLAVIQSFFSYAVKSGYLPTNIAAFLPKMEVHHKISERYLTQEEVVRMIAMTGEFRDQVILKTLYTGGLRLSELIALNWEHLQEREKGEGQLLILGKGNKKRVVVLSPGVFKELLKLQPHPVKVTSAVFTSREWGNPRLSKRSIQIIVDKARLRAGIPKRVTPHWLRHAHASHSLDQGAPIHLVQATLGHASVATTGKYLHARPQESSSRFLPF